MGVSTLDDECHRAEVFQRLVSHKQDVVDGVGVERGGVAVDERGDSVASQEERVRQQRVTVETVGGEV